MHLGEVLTEDTYNLVEGLFGSFFDAQFSLQMSRSGAYTVGKVTHPIAEDRFARVEYAGGDLALLGTDTGFHLVSLAGDFDEPTDHDPFFLVAKIGREYVLNGGRVVERRWRSDKMVITVDGCEWVLRAR